jgi:hypothetical protein
MDARRSRRCPRYWSPCPLQRDRPGVAEPGRDERLRAADDLPIIGWLRLRGGGILAAGGLATVRVADPRHLLVPRDGVDDSADEYDPEDRQADETNEGVPGGIASWSVTVSGSAPPSGSEVRHT